MAEPLWKQQATQAQERREKELPSRWRIPDDKLPSADTKCVIDFPEKSGLLTEEELEITKLNVPDLLSKIADKTYTAEAVATAYAHRAAIAHQLTNCLSNMFFERGIERAKELDEYYAQHGKLVGPFHGLPVSIKDNHHIKGTTAGIGFCSLSVENSTKDSDTVRLLTKLGAVVYCKTTVPLAMLSVETDSRVMGLTTNPHNRNHTAGGSSGGEAALAALGGSPVGIGSDIGGSIRIPAAYNGIYGLNPTSLRFPTGGQQQANTGQTFVKAASGPIARDLDSIRFVSRVILNAHPEEFDNNCIPLGYRDDLKLESKEKRLTFGIVRTDGVVRPIKGIQKALDQVVESLKKQGHEVIEWKPIGNELMNTAQTLFFTADGATGLKKYLQEEPLLEHSKGYAALLVDRPNSTTFAMQSARLDIERKVFEQWQATASETTTGKPIDGIIAPISALAGLGHRKYFYNGYTSYWNILDYPGVSIPVSEFSDPASDGPIDEIKSAPISEIETKLYDSWDPASAVGGQIGLQVIAPRFFDELAIEYADMIVSGLQSK